ncbi:hypothetical protein TrRE_jg1187 [Triparma retinervis]|uniref:Myb-like domain-containing protein n=1 Tax=Triparma retinervis TaxID=2557542 RepID=A0A9W6ZFE5_9STRA|nr:hypothetical protein TrRE_jg1187 [Triparma retinervis]
MSKREAQRVKYAAKRSTKVKGSTGDWTSEDLKEAFRACAAVKNPNLPKIYKEAVAKHTGKKPIFSVKTLRRRWKKICDKAMLQTGLDKATMDNDTVLGIINGVKRYGGTGGSQRAFSDATGTLLWTTNWEQREIKKRRREKRKQ